MEAQVNVTVVKWTCMINSIICKCKFVTQGVQDTEMDFLQGDCKWYTS